MRATATSSASGRSSTWDRAATSIAAGHGSGRPAPARSPTARRASPTAAVGGGRRAGPIEVAPTTGPPADGQVQPAQRIRPGTGAPSGSPATRCGAAPGAHRTVPRASATTGTPAATDSASVAGRRRVRASRAVAGADQRRQVGDRRRHTSADSRCSAAAGWRPPFQHGVQRPEAGPARRSTWRGPAPRPGRRRQAGGGGRPGSARASAGSSRSAWLSTTTVMSRCWPNWPRYCWCTHPVGVLLRVEHPHHEVDQAEQAVHLDAVAPRPSRSRAGPAGRGRRRARRPRRERFRAMTRPGDRRAGRRASRAARRRGSAPQTQAWAAPVVGRRSPTGDRSTPARALKMLDFPLPVAPARATTVWARDRASRSPARSTTARAASSRAAGGGAVTSRSDAGASTRSTPRRRATSHPAGRAVGAGREDSAGPGHRVGGGPQRGRRGRGRRPGPPAPRGTGRPPRPAAAPTRSSRSLCGPRSARSRTAWSPKIASSTFCAATVGAAGDDHLGPGRDERGRGEHARSSRPGRAR